MPLSQGEVLKERYRIVKKLGEGGFGAVYRAWDLNLKGPCAVKENFETSPAAQRQFLQEASLLFNLRHPHLPRVFDSFSVPGQGQYLVMDYIEGRDLQELLDQQGTALDQDQVLPWMLDVCAALSYLHGQQPPIIHRDLKPANVRITPDGRAFLVDFGIAKMYDPIKRTTMGARAATPGYAPFEQYGQGQTDARSDVYALGATMYTALTGVVPPESIARVDGEELAPPITLNPQISAYLQDVILKAMAIFRNDRYQRVSELKADLEACQKAGTPKPVTATMVVPSVQSASAAASVQAGGSATPLHGTPGSTGGGQTKGGLSRSWLLGGAAGLVLFTVLCVIGIMSLIDGPGDSSTLMVTETTKKIIPTPTESLATVKFVDDYGVRMAWLPAGAFMMGSEDGDADEDPIHEVWLDTFAIDIYEVTNELYEECVAAGVCDTPGCDYYGDAQYDDHPVVCVSWYDAQDYCEWRGVRLPTEAEWEKAARGGLEGKQYPWGDQAPVCEKGASNGAQYSSCDGQTVPVGSYSTNGYGLFDMAGNVWEWVSDWYGEDYYVNPPYENPSGPSSGKSKVLRGGGWRDLPHDLRSATRFSPYPVYSLDYFGFRCVSGAVQGK